MAGALLPKWYSLQRSRRLASFRMVAAFARSRTQFRMLSLLPALGLALAGCGSQAASDSFEPGRSGALLVYRYGLLAGVRYTLAASFDVSGPESCTLDSRSTTAALARELTPGRYQIAIRSDALVFADEIVAELPVASELASEPSEPFQIAADATTRVSYRFNTDAGLVSFDEE